MSFELPVEASADLAPKYSFSASGTQMATIAHNWDLYLNGAVLDLGTYRLPYFSFGFAKRWGG